MQAPTKTLNMVLAINKHLKVSKRIKNGGAKQRRESPERQKEEGC